MLCLSIGASLLALAFSANDNGVLKADDIRFISQAKGGVETARATALAAYLGRIVAVEHGLESDGKASCEVDTLKADKEKVKVEIDAVIDKIVDVGYESY